MNLAPKTLHIVLNGVTEDSRVLKCAWSLGNAGWDVLVIGATHLKFVRQRAPEFRSFDCNKIFTLPPRPKTDG